MGLKRGDIVTVALQGDFGKPRPAVIVESDALPPTNHVLVCIGTSHLVDEPAPRRVSVMPGTENGLLMQTQFQSDKVTPVRREKCGAVIGRLDRSALSELSVQLSLLLGITE